MMSLKEASIIYIGYVVPFFAVIPLLISITKFSKLPGELKVLSFYLTVSITFSVVINLLAIQGINNLPAIHLYTVCEFILISLFFYRVFQTRHVKRLILWSAALFFLFFVVDISFFESIYNFNNYNKTVESIIVILFSVFYFIQSLDDSPKHTLSHTAISYAVSGILVYFSSSLILFIFLNIDPRYINTHIIIWDIHASFLLLMFILFSIGLWKYRQTKTYYH